MTSRFGPAFALLVLLGCLLGCKGEDILPTEPATPPPPAPDPAPTLIATATLEGANDYHTAGTARLERHGESQTLRLDDDFETDQSPALDVRLCTRKRCGNDDLVLGAIQSFQGEQTYAVPGDGSEYDFVVIWCAAVELPFGTGRLQ